MRIEWQVEADPGLSDLGAEQALLERAARAVLEVEGLLGKYQACVVLTDDAGIREVNRRTRGIDAATDVLSFPLARFPRGTARDHPNRLRSLLDPETGCRHLGDVVISAERAKEQAARYGHELRRELGYLLVHGACHLLGYDHILDDDKARMRAVEEEAMTRAGLPREAPQIEGGFPMNDEKLLEMARQAMRAAYAPYSHYPVGACLLAEDGRVFSGCNVENASYGATICAERTALVKAVSEGARRFTAIAVAAQGSAPFPCGVCRQALNEFGPKMRVLVTWGEQSPETAETTLDALLPNSFGPESLGEQA